jgi:hypothetical protein
MSFLESSWVLSVSELNYFSSEVEIEKVVPKSKLSSKKQLMLFAAVFVVSSLAQPQITHAAGPTKQVPWLLVVPPTHVPPVDEAPWLVSSYDTLSPRAQERHDRHVQDQIEAGALQERQNREAEFCKAAPEEQTKIQHSSCLHHFLLLDEGLDRDTDDEKNISRALPMLLRDVKSKDLDFYDAQKVWRECFWKKVSDCHYRKCNKFGCNPGACKYYDTQNELWVSHMCQTYKREFLEKSMPVLPHRVPSVTVRSPRRLEIQREKTPTYLDSQLARTAFFSKIAPRKCEIKYCDSSSHSLESHYGICLYHREKLCKCSNFGLQQCAMCSRKVTQRRPSCICTPPLIKLKIISASLYELNYDADELSFRSTLCENCDQKLIW